MTSTLRSFAPPVTLAPCPETASPRPSPRAHARAQSLRKAQASHKGL